MQEDAPLSADERAELEQLRAEKQARMAADADERARIAQARERGRALMEPGDDLAMPKGQKIVLIGLAVVVLVIIAMFVLMPK